MGTKVIRKKYIHTNKYQRRIIGLAIVPSLLVCFFISIVIKIFHKTLIDVLLFGSVTESVEFINRWAIWIMAGIWTFVVLVVIGAYIVSLNLVGAFERIVREMDEVIDGKDRKRIIARTNDDLANDLLKRINIFIANLPHPRTKLKQ